MVIQNQGVTECSVFFMFRGGKRRDLSGPNGLKIFSWKESRAQRREKKEKGRYGMLEENCWIENPEN